LRPIRRTDEILVTDFGWKLTLRRSLVESVEGDWLKAAAEPVVISYKKWGQIIDMNGTLFQPDRRVSNQSHAE